MSPCPDKTALQQLLDDALPANEVETIQTHLDDCASCQKTLQSLAAASGDWSEAARHLRGDESEADSAVDRLVASLENRTGRDETVAENEPAAGDELDFLTPSEKPDSLGRLGHYEIQDIIGRGGMGIVLKAFDEKLHRIVAIKVMSPDMAAGATARRRFNREARAAAAVAHDHIVTIHAVEEGHRPPYLVMELVDGKSLQQRLDESGPLKVEEILRIASQTARGLTSAHKQGLVHRDIKPANILLENGVERVKITDFGLARAADDASLTQSGVITGTPMFMSPEQAEGKNVDHRSDLFSLGSVLYAMCTGHPPFRAGGTMAVMKRVCEDTPRPIRETNTEIPQWLCDIIAKLHAKKPEHRFQSAEETAELLEQWLAHVQRPEQAPRPVRSSAPVTATFEVSEEAADSANAVAPRHYYLLATLALLIGVFLLWLPLSWSFRSNRTDVRIDLGVLKAIQMGYESRPGHFTLALREIRLIPFIVSIAFTIVGLIAAGRTFQLWRHYRRGQRALKAPRHRRLRIGWLVVLAAFALFVLLPALAIRFDAGYDKPVSDDFQLASSIAVVIFGVAAAIVLFVRGRRHKVASAVLIMLLAIVSTFAIWKGPSLYRLANGQARIVLWRGNPETRFVLFRDGKVVLDIGKRLRQREYYHDLESGTYHLVVIPPHAHRVSSWTQRSFRKPYFFDASVRSDVLKIQSEYVHQFAIKAGEEIRFSTAAEPDDNARFALVRIISRDPSFRAEVYRLAGGREVPVFQASKSLAVKQNGTWGRVKVLPSAKYKIKIWQNDNLKIDETFALEDGKPRTWEVNAAGATPFVKLAKTWGTKNKRLPILCLDVSPDGSVVTGNRGSFGGTAYSVTLWPVDRDGKSFTSFNPDDVVNDVAFSPDGKSFAWVQGNGKLRRQGTTSGDSTNFKRTKEPLHCLAWSPDGKTIVTGGEGTKHTLFFWDVKAGSEPDPRFAQGGAVLDVAYSPDGKRLAIAGFNGFVGTWDVKRRMALLYPRTTHVGEAHGLAWLNNRVLLSCGEDGKFHKWSADTGANEGSTLIAQGRPIRAIAVSPDGTVQAFAGFGSKGHSIFLTGDGIKTQLELGKREGGHTGEVTSLVFSHDGNYLISGSKDGTIKFWEFAKPLAPKDDGFVQLFNGKDLTGWKAHPNQSSVWMVGQGDLIGKGPKSSFLLTERSDFEDFHFRAEVKVNDKGKCGIYFRRYLSSFKPKAGQHVLTGYAILLSSGTKKQVDNQKPDSSMGNTCDHLIEPEKWTTVDVTYRANLVTIKVNGKLVAERCDFDYFHKKGHIVLQQGPGTVAQFRNIRIDELPREPLPLPLPRQQIPQDRWIRLFNGKDLTGWHMLTGVPGWHVKNGELVASGNRGLLYFDRDDLYQFHLRMEVTIERGPVDAGVHFNCNHDRSPEGWLAQIIDDPKQRAKTGSLRGTTEREPGGHLVFQHVVERSLAKPGEWFLFEVISDSKNMQVKINGTPTVTHPHLPSQPGLPVYTKHYNLALRHPGDNGVLRIRNIELKRWFKENHPLKHLREQWRQAKLPFTESFDNPYFWLAGRKGAQWGLVTTEERRYLSLLNRTINPFPRTPRPHNCVLLTDSLMLTDFTLECDLQSTRKLGRKSERDLCILFGYQKPDRYYFVHLAGAAGIKNPAANQIFLVDGKQVKAITKTNTHKTPWDDKWHKVKITRVVKSGKIEVYFDNMIKPVMTAEDKTLTWGQVGLGSHDDAGNFDNFKLQGIQKPSQNSALPPAWIEVHWDDPALRVSLARVDVPEQRLLLLKKGKNGPFAPGRYNLDLDNHFFQNIVLEPSETTKVQLPETGTLRVEYADSKTCIDVDGMQRFGRKAAKGYYVQRRLTVGKHRVQASVGEETYFDKMIDIKARKTSVVRVSTPKPNNSKKANSAGISKLQGLWSLIRVEAGGKIVPIDGQKIEKIEIRFGTEEFEMYVPGNEQKTVKGTYRIDPGTKKIILKIKEAKKGTLEMPLGFQLKEDRLSLDLGSSTLGPPVLKTEMKMRLEFERRKEDKKKDAGGKQTGQITDAPDILGFELRPSDSALFCADRNSSRQYHDI